MISCEHCEELLSARLDGELSQEDSLLLKEHLEQCPDCRKLDRDLTALRTHLKALSSQPSEDFASAILSQLEVPTMQSENKKKKGPWAVIACAAAAVVLMVAVLSPFGGSEGDTASAEAGEAPASADVTGGAPAEDKAQEESRTEEEADPLPPIEPLTEQEALKLLQNYLIDMGLSLDIEPGDLSPDESFWSFTARSKDTGERYLYSVYCIDGFVEEIMIP